MTDQTSAPIHFGPSILAAYGAFAILAAAWNGLAWPEVLIPFLVPAAWVLLWAPDTAPSHARSTLGVLLAVGLLITAALAPYPHRLLPTLIIVACVVIALALASRATASPPRPASTLVRVSIRLASALAIGLLLLVALGQFTAAGGAAACVACTVRS